MRREALLARLREVEAEMRALEEGWGDWLERHPRPEVYIYDPYLAWAWPQARGRYALLLEERKRLLRELKKVGR